MKYYLAIDIGASSGRHIVGIYKDGKLETDEVYRFQNGVHEENGHLVWDVEYLFNEVKKGIKEVLKIYPNIESMAIDTWGVDYVLMRKDKEVLPVYAYRDTRTKDIIDEVHDIIPFADLYSITGCQFQEFNTIYQLYKDKKDGRLDGVTDFLHIPEYLMYKLSGVKVKEYTNASTTGMMDLSTNNYSQEIIEKLGFDKSLFKPLFKQGYIIGEFKKEIQKEVNGNIKLCLCSTHDTAAAVEGIPMKSDSPYISSGTWSLFGIKHEKGINSRVAMRANYSNEYGPNYIRVQKNIMGMWINNNLAKELKVTAIDLEKMAATSKYNEIFDVNADCFLSSLSMKKTITQWYIRHQKKAPKTNADFARAVVISLAYSYKKAIEELEKITKKTYEEIYIVGGGAKNKLLNKLTEEYTQKRIIALPIEATAIGNLLGQIKGV